MQPRPLLFYNHSDSAPKTKNNDTKFRHDCLIQLCCHEGCRNVANFTQGYGFCHSHQTQNESIGTDNEQRQDDLDSERCGKDDETETRECSWNVDNDETTSYEALCKAVEQSCSRLNVETKHDHPSEDPLTSTTETKRQKLTIDLSDVPKQPPIPKMRRIDGTSQYTGVHWRKSYKKWVAKIKIDGKEYQLGTFENEEDAAVQYARAVFKYNKRYRSLMLLNKYLEET